MEGRAACTECGAPMGPGDGLGLCPRCVLRSALDLSDGTTEAWPGFPGTSAGVPEAPTRFDDYELLEEVGRGAMGIVYRARQASLDRVVALKVLRSGAWSGTEGRRRFLTEAAAAARLQHPGIVAVYGAGTWDGQPFYSMEFVEGPTLAEVLRRRDLPHERAATYVARLAEAVHFAHERGVLHRDLKPSNILIDANDRPRIADFGLARVRDASVGPEAGPGGETLAGQVLGSPAYMPPEQACGRSTEVGPASDVYGLGAILYEAIAGRPPFQGDSAIAVLEQVRSEEPIPPRRLKAGVPIDLETVCLRCLEKSPARRYASAAALAEELHRFLRGEPVRARPVGPMERTWRWARRNPAVAGLGAVAAGLLVTVAAVAVIAAVRVRASRDEARARLAESHLSEARAVGASGEAGHRAAVLDLVARALALDGMGRLRLPQRREAIAALARPDERRVVAASFPASVDPMLVCFDPAFETCATWDEPTKGFVLRSVPRGEPRVRFAAPRADEIVAVSGDRRFVVLRHGDRTSVWEASTGREVVPRENSEGSGGLPGGAFGPGSAWFGRGERGGRFVTYAREEGRGVRVVRDWPLPRNARVGAVAWSPDGAWLVLTTHDGGLAVCASETGAVRWQTGPGSGPFWGVAWNGPRNWVAAQTRGDRLLVFDASNGAEVHRLHTPTDASARVAFSPDGARMAVSTERFGTRLFEAATGRLVSGDPAPSWHLHFDPAGRRLGTLFVDARPAWREWMPSEVLESLGTAASGNNQVLEFHPDGSRVCSLSAEGPMVWEVGRAGASRLSGVPGTDYAVFDLDPARLLLSAGRELHQVAWGTQAGAEAPRVVARGEGFWGVAVSRSRGWVAVADHKGNAVHVLDREYRPWRVLGPVELPGYVAFSPDGRWLATVGGRDLWVWDLDAPGGEPKRLPGGEPTPRFSPDGRWLVTLGSEVRAWRVGTWEPGGALPLVARPTGSVVAAFSPDGRWLVATQRESELHWIDFAARRTVAVLEGPGEGRILDLAFSPDGTRLAVARERGEVQTWNVDALRRELRSRSLDWD